MTYEQAYAQMKRFAEKVMPHLKAGAPVPA
jgi:hypothetical protein